MFVYKSSLKIMALVTNCTAVEHHAVIHFLWAEGIHTPEAHNLQQAQRFAVQGRPSAPQ
jgi:hypothetical protein